MDTPAVYTGLRSQLGAAVEAVEYDNPDPYIVVHKAHWRAAAALVRFTFGYQFMESLTAVDTRTHLWLVLHAFSYQRHHGLVLKTRLAYDDLEVASLCDIWAAANWHEREQYDLFGITFTGHPNLRRLLLPDDWVGHPLRKNYVYPVAYQGISHHRADPIAQLKAMDELRASAARARAQTAADAAADAASSVASSDAADDAPAALTAPDAVSGLAEGA